MAGRVRRHRRRGRRHLSGQRPVQDDLSLGDELDFYATTGEGILWHGRIENDRLLPLDSVTTGHPGVAPVLDILPGASFLATADHDVRVFQPRNGGGTTRRIAVVHAFPGLGEVRANRLLLEKAIRMAAAAGARWIVTPELSESGCADAYGPEIARDYARLGVDLLLSSAAWAPGSMGSNGVWEDRSRETGVPPRRL